MNNGPPAFGAWIEEEGVRFRIWAPAVTTLELVWSAHDGKTGAQPLPRDSQGYFSTWLRGVTAGLRYRYRVDGQGPFPDPASRFQPEGVHGPSEVVDPALFPWTDSSWRGLPLKELVFYELHVGTFTAAGTFAGVEEKLLHLRDLGVTAIELMPLGDFPGRWNWGYDGVSFFAPARQYGRPDDLRRLVDAAHHHGLAVFLDVVYNHFGPDGNYTGLYSKQWYTARHHTPWGDAINFDGPGSEHVRAFFIDNALHWIREYHLDGLRLDATHAILDEGPRPFLAELTERAHDAAPERQVWIIAEDHRNLAHMLQPASAGGWGLDGVWADDFHHELRRFLTGDNEGYFRDYSGTIADLVTTINQGWFFTGQHSDHAGEPRGTDPTGIPPRAFVLCLQNHDQVGNRPCGDRLHHQIDLATWRAISTLLLSCPGTPLLFMGQEWAASSPFRFFTDHHTALGRLVTEGRRKEFRHFSAFSDPQKRENIPDPQAESTFTSSRLVWEECERSPHRETLTLYKELLRLRGSEPAFRDAGTGCHRTRALGEDGLALHRWCADGSDVLLVCQLRGAGKVRINDLPTGNWHVFLHTEESRFAADGMPVTIQQEGGCIAVDFDRAGAVLMRRQK